MLLKKGGQAAMEFLMTYGWAILGVLIAIAALSYFGILDIGRFSPDRCEGSAEISCKDFVLGSDTIALSVNNNIGEAIIIYNATFTGDDVQKCVWNGPILLPHTEAWTITAWGCYFDEVNKKSNVQADLVYSKTGSGFDRIQTIYLKGTVQDQSVLNVEEICQAAQDYSLCCGLDIIFGQGFKQMCEDDYGLCTVSC